MELRLVQSKSFIENPQIEIHAEDISPACSWGWLPFSPVIVCCKTPYSDCLFGGHSLSGWGLFIFLFLLHLMHLILPWYIHTGWLGIKHQFTYLLTDALTLSLPIGHHITSQEECFAFDVRWWHCFNSDVLCIFIRSKHLHVNIFVWDLSQKELEPAAQTLWLGKG